MDLAYLRAHPHHLPTFLTHQRIRETPVPGGSICTASPADARRRRRRVRQDLAGAGDRPVPDGFFATEAAGLGWLRVPDGAPVPEVIVALPELLALEWVEPGEPDRGGRRARSAVSWPHCTGPARTAFGAPWPGFIGALPQDNTADRGPWPAVVRRAPARAVPAHRSTDSGALTADRRRAWSSG